MTMIKIGTKNTRYPSITMRPPFLLNSSQARVLIRRITSHCQGSCLTRGILKLFSISGDPLAGIPFSGNLRMTVHRLSMEPFRDGGRLDQRWFPSEILRSGSLDEGQSDGVTRGSQRGHGETRSPVRQCPFFYGSRTIP